MNKRIPPDGTPADAIFDDPEVHDVEVSVPLSEAFDHSEKSGRMDGMDGIVEITHDTPVEPSFDPNGAKEFDEECVTDTDDRPLELAALPDVPEVTNVKFPPKLDPKIPHIFSSEDTPIPVDLPVHTDPAQANEELIDEAIKTLSESIALVAAEVPAFILAENLRINYFEKTTREWCQLQRERLSTFEKSTSAKMRVWLTSLDKIKEARKA